MAARRSGGAFGGQCVNRDTPISLWEATSAEPDFQAPLDAGPPVDVAIVGGGYTGLSTALHAAEAGLAVHVIEAKQIGFGGSGRNVGLVNAGAWLPPQKIRALLGDAQGGRFLEVFGAGPASVLELIERYQIRCEATRTGTIHAAHAPSGLADLRRRAAEWQAMGEPVALLDREQMQEMTGTRAYCGGLLDHRAGTINPMGYCRGLARAALAAGAKISTKARATKIARDDAGWRVETDQGNVHAKAVVLGTNAYTDQLWPGLRDIFTPFHYFQFATGPLGQAAQAILPGRQGLWDTRPIMFNIRRDAQDRLLVGSMGQVIGGAGHGLSARFARKRIAQMFPALGPVTFEQAWHGTIAKTPDNLPRIYQLAEGIYAPTGYNGRGITTGTVFGKVMADLLRDVAAPLPVPLTQGIKPARGAKMMARAYQAVFAANQMLRAL